MFLVRETFIAKPGYAGKLAKMMKEEMGKWKEFKGYVLLDCVGKYNTIIVEYELEHLDKFEKHTEEHKKKMAEMKSDQPPEYTQYYIMGKREIFKIL